MTLIKVEYMQLIYSNLKIYLNSVFKRDDWKSGSTIFNENEDSHDIFQKIMYLVHLEHIREIWVQGDKVHSR